MPDQQPPQGEQEQEILAEQETDTSDSNEDAAQIRAALTRCEAQGKEYLEGWQRAKADFINYKNDEGKRLEDLGRFISASMLHDLLPILDGFDLALQSFQESALSGGSQEQGVLMIRSQFTDVLKKRGIVQIPVTIGAPFNPEQHESIGEVESSHPTGSVAEEVQKGYMLAGRVIRPARVRLGKERRQ